MGLEFRERGQKLRLEGSRLSKRIVHGQSEDFKLCIIIIFSVNSKIS